MEEHLVQIIYLNGPSSSGKTTLAKALQNALDIPFLHVGIDKIIGWMPEKLNDWTGGEAPLGYSWKKSQDESGSPIHELQVGPFAKKIRIAFREVVLTLAKLGHHLIIDDVAFGKNQVDEWKEALRDFQVLWVGVNAPLAVIEEREKERGNRILGSARGQFHKVHSDAIYDVEVDTHHVSIYENVAKIEAFSKKEKTKSLDSYTLEYYDRIPSDYEGILFKGISDYALEKKGHASIQPLSIFVKKQAGNVVGGISGVMFYGCLYIDSLWIEKPLRHCGWGSKLMGQFEKIGKEKGASFATVHTMDWEGLPFYQKLGYTIEFVREGYENDSKMYLLRKKL